MERDESLATLGDDTALLEEARSLAAAEATSVAAVTERLQTHAGRAAVSVTAVDDYQPK